MNVQGIIAEYNPFHNGHLYHLEQSRKVTGADASVAVMSGNFVQRGEPAILNKWIRSEMAVRNGVDLVVELPFAYGCNNAELFSRGGVELLDGLGCIDSVCFGSENGEIAPLQEISDILTEESPDFSRVLKEKLGEGVSFPKGRQEALADFAGAEKASLLESPNNILGIEYLKQLSLIDSKMEPFTIKRTGAAINEKNAKHGMAGATAIRDMIDVGDFYEAMGYMPLISRKILAECRSCISSYEMFRELIIYSIISKSNEEIANIYSVTEGLENKAISAAKESASINEMIDNIKSKRYTQTRIQRILIHILTCLTREKMNIILEEKQMYARVLAFNETGASLLKQIKKKDMSSIPIITNISKESDNLKTCRELFDYDMMSTDIFNLAVTHDIHKNSDYRRVPAFVKG